MNHFAKQCRSKAKEPSFKQQIQKKSQTPKSVHQISDSATCEKTGHTSSSDEAYVYVVNTTKPANLPQTTVNMMGTQTLVLIDPGATANCISEAT